MIIALKEALSANAKVHEVATDGIPEIGKLFVAFLTSHEKYVLAERLNNSDIKPHWDSPEKHKGPGEAFYSDKGYNGSIYAMTFESYVYVDDLNLMPTSHTNKVAREQEAAMAEAERLTNELIKVYGAEDGQALADRMIHFSKNGRRAELIGYDEYLLRNFGYSSAVKDLYNSLKKYFDKDIAKRILFNNKEVAAYLNRGIRYYFNKTNAADRDLQFASFLSFGFITAVEDDTVIFTQVTAKANVSDLFHFAERKGLTRV